MAVTPQFFHFDGLGVRLAGERWDGAQTGDIVLLLHGGGQTRHSWKSTARRLAATGRQCSFGLRQRHDIIRGLSILRLGSYSHSHSPLGPGILVI